MHQFVQSAIDAANQGDNNKAMGFIKEVLSVNPNDVDAWLVLAAIVDQPERKRQCLNRVLSLEPTNKIAREELLGMDRAAMGGSPPFIPEPVADTRQVAPVSQTQPQPALQPLSYSAADLESQSAPAPVSTPQPRAQSSRPKTPTKAKTLSFRLPIMTRLTFYLFAVLGLYLSITTLMEHEISLTLIFFVMFLAMCAFSLGASFRIDVNEAGILVDTIIAESRIAWNEISEIKSGSYQQGLELKRNNGKSVKVSGAVKNYPVLVDILRQKRPDLFGMASPTGNSSSGTFAGSKTYKKSILMQYGGIIIGIPLLILCIIVVLNGYSEYFFVGIFLGLYSIYLIFQPFFHVFEIKVEPSQLTLEMMFDQKVLSPSQIEKIWIKTVRGKYGSAFHYVMVKPVQGRALSLRGFGVGEEVLYGTLMNWWNASNK